MPIEALEARSWLHVQQLLFENSWQENIKRHRSEYIFRGVGSERYALTTALQRLGGDDNPAHGAGVERFLLRSFIKYAYQETSLGSNEWYWLSLAQHHGLPTRLLDWTNSPLVALHFATVNAEHSDEDGAVWCVHVDHAHDHLPQPFKESLQDNGALVFTVEMLQDLAKDIEAFNRFAESGENFVVFFEPPSLDARIVNQFAFFSMMPDPEAKLDDWLEQHPDLYRKIIIPKGLKWEIRNKLDQMNITERVLFPGLDGLSLWLKRYYSPHPAWAENTEDTEMHSTVIARMDNQAT